MVIESAHDMIQSISFPFFSSLKKLTSILIQPDHERERERESKRQIEERENKEVRRKRNQTWKVGERINGWKF